MGSEPTDGAVVKAATNAGLGDGYAKITYEPYIGYDRDPDALIARLREAEAHLWAMVVHFGGTYDNPYVHRDVCAAAAYVERHLADEGMDMTLRHRAVIQAGQVDGV